MTDLEHDAWMRVAAASKRGRWSRPSSSAQKAALTRLRNRGYFDHPMNFDERRGRVRYRPIAFYPYGAPR